MRQVQGRLEGQPVKEIHPSRSAVIRFPKISRIFYVTTVESLPCVLCVLCVCIVVSPHTDILLSAIHNPRPHTPPSCVDASRRGPSSDVSPVTAASARGGRRGARARAVKEKEQGRDGDGRANAIFFRVVFERQSKTENSTNQHQSPNPPLTKHLSGAPRPCIPWLARSASCFGSRLNHGYKRRARTYDASAAWAFAPPMPRDEMSQLANSVSSSGHVPIQSQTQLSCGQFCIAQFCTHHASE